MFLRPACLILLAALSMQAAHAHEGADLMDKTFKVMVYKTSASDPEQKPSRSFTLHFRGDLRKGWVELNTFYSMYCGYEISGGGHGWIKFETRLSEKFDCCPTDSEKTFEKNFAAFLPKMTSYLLRNDTLWLKGDGEIMLTRTGSLKQRLQGTWISDKDSLQYISVNNDTWTYSRGGEDQDTNLVYHMETEDWKWMDGDWNKVCDYVLLTGKRDTIEFWVIGAGSSLLLSAVHGKQYFNYKRSEYHQSLAVHKKDREEIRVICDSMVSAFRDKEHPEKILQFIPSRRKYIRYAGAGAKGFTEKRKKKRSAKNFYRDVYRDSLQRWTVRLRLQGKKEGFKWKSAYAWAVSSGFYEQEGQEKARVVLTLSDRNKKSVAFEIYLEMIKVKDKWYLYPVLERYSLVNYK